MTEQTFSQSTIDAVLAEADKAGIKGASKISEALRKQLTDAKRGNAALVPDNRTKTYYVVGVAWWHMRKAFIREVGEIVGLDSVGSLFMALYEYAFEAFPEFPNDIADPANLEGQTNGVRANLTRKGEGHFQLVAPPVDGVHKAWLDVFVYNTPAAAEAKLAELAPQKG